MTTKRSLPAHSSIRWDPDAQKLTNAWFKKNPHWTVTQLVNSALKEFVVKAHTTKPVELEDVDADVWERAVNDAMREHADALERLK